MSNKDDLIKPTKSIVFDKTRVFYDESNSIGLHEKAIRTLFDAFPGNKDLSEVLLKVTILDQYYSTRIPSLVKYAKAICEIDNLDERLADGDLSVVEEISVALQNYNKKHPEENRVPKDAENKCYLSFASKYCSHHDIKGDTFPIFDSIASKLLCDYDAIKHSKKQTGFYDWNRSYQFRKNVSPREQHRLTQEKIRNIALYRDAVREFRKFYKLEGLTLKQLDIFLWMYGQELAEQKK